MKLSNNKFAAILEGCEYTAEDAEQVRQLVGSHRAVVVRNSAPVAPATLVEFYKRIGDVVAQNEKVKGNVDGHGELIKVRKNGLFSGTDDGELEWHSAGMNRTGHDDIVVMYMHQIADGGGDTFFSDHQTAFQDLDDETKDKLRNIKSKILTYHAKLKLEQMYYKNIFSDEQTMMEFRDIDGGTSFDKQTPRKDIVSKHPINGVEGLYFPWTVIRGFTGLDKQEQHDMYYMLKEHVQKDKYVYCHKWQPYDIIFSDQHHSLHKRDSYVGDRELWRAGIWLRSESGTNEAWTCESLVPEEADA